jgi:hypothetical protein
MMLSAGRTWCAAVLPCGEQSLLAAVPPRRAARPGRAAALPARLRPLDVNRRNCSVVPSTGVTTQAAEVDPRGFPVDATVIHDRNGEYVKHGQFYLHGTSGTTALDDDDKQTYLAQRWPGAA